MIGAAQRSSAVALLVEKNPWRAVHDAVLD
jgi:hypothetical protein